MDKKIIIGLGSGRCGTKSLAYLLNKQSGVTCTHEVFRLPWEFKETKIRNIHSLFSKKRKDVVGDVAFYYLNYVKYLINQYPNIKFICLKRDRDETIKSYIEKTFYKDHWRNFNVKKKEGYGYSVWDKCYPTYSDIVDKGQAIAQYYDDYYLKAEELQADYPEKFLLLNTEDAFTSDGQKKIFIFCSLDNYKIIDMPKINKTSEERKVMTYLKDKVTFVIKTFKRPKCLKILVKSILKYYPGFKIIVVNDDKKSIGFKDTNIKEVRPDNFNIGLSAGRNIAVSHVDTEYFVLLDDDYIFTEKTDIGKLYSILKEEKADIVAGEQINIPSKAIVDFYGDLEIKDKVLSLKKRKNKEVLKCDLVPNFFIASSSIKDKIKWDDRLKIGGEHLDFFLRAKEIGLKVFYTSHVKINHNVGMNRGKEYTKYRNNYKNSFLILAEKNNINRIKIFNRLERIIDLENSTVQTKNYK